MPRKGSVPKRVVLPDPVYDSELVARFINRMMKGGKKAVAEGVFYKAMEIVEQKTGKPAMEVFEQAIENVAPQVEVRPRRVGGQTYQVPMEVRAERRRSLAIRWIVTSLQRKKTGATRARTAGARDYRRLQQDRRRVQKTRRHPPYGGGEPRVRSLPLVRRQILWRDSTR